MTQYANSSSENKRDRKTQALTTLLSATALGVFLEGCGGGGSDTSGSDTSGSGTVAISQGTADNPFRGSTEEQTFVAAGGGWVTYEDISASQFDKSIIVTHFQQHRPAWVNLLDPFPQTFSGGVVASLADPSINFAEAQGDTYTNIENLIGTDYVDALEGNNNDNILEGLAGDDLLSGRGGEDVLSGDAGADYLDGGEGRDTASYFYAPGTAVTLDIFFAGFVLTENYWATWYSSLSIDFVLGVLASLTTPDANLGVAHFDTYVSIENLEGSEHVDILEGNGDANTIWGNAGDDLLSGLGGNDFLFGGEGDDILLGGSGVDFIEGEEGDDILVGEAGSDVYIFYANDGTDIIYDTQGQGDQEYIAFISDATGTYGYSNNNADSFDFVRITTGLGGNADDLRIDTDLGNSVIIVDYYAAPAAYEIYYDSNPADSFIVNDLTSVAVSI